MKNVKKHLERLLMLLEYDMSVLTWEDCSGVVCGLVLNNKYSLNAVRQEMFFPPYDSIIKALKGGITEPEELIEICGFAGIVAAHEAVKDINGAGELNWIALLERAYANYDAGQKLEKFGRKLQRGEEVDWSILNQYEQRALEGVGGDFVPLSKVVAKEMPFIPSGWDAIDQHLQGLPEVGVVVVGGDPGVGKTTFMAKLVQKFAARHTEKKVAVFSIEMVLSELAMRFNEIGNIPEKVRDRILLNDFPVSADELVNKAATIDDLGLICVDFVDMMIRENSEAEYSKAYLTLANASKRLHCPIIVIAQLVKYSGGLPKKKHLRYSRMAEAFPSMILMLYDPSTAWSSDEDKEDTVLPIVSGRAYVLCWKVRGGFRNHLDESPGAIQMAFRGDKGWAGDGKNSRWFSLKKES